MPDTSNKNLTVKAWLTNMPIEDRIEQVRRLWYEVTGHLTILEKIMRTGEPSDELFEQYKEKIAECQKWNELLEALKESPGNSDELYRARFTKLRCWIGTHGIESLPWKDQT